MRERMSGVEEGMEKKKEREKFVAEIDRLALGAKNAKTEEEKKKISDRLWFKIRPDVRGNIIKNSPKDAADIEHDLYLKLPKCIDYWKEDLGNFNSYLFVVLRNLIINKSRKFKQEKRWAGEVKNVFYGGSEEYNKIDLNLTLEDRIMINKIKINLMDWVKSGLLQAVEAMALILKFGLGKGMVGELIGNFPTLDLFKNLKNSDLKNAEFDWEIDQQKVANLLGFKTQGGISKVITRAINKIKN